LLGAFAALSSLGAFSRSARSALAGGGGGGAQQRRQQQGCVFLPFLPGFGCGLVMLTAWA